MTSRRPPWRRLATDYEVTVAGPDDDDVERVVPVPWIDVPPQSHTAWQKGIFASRHIACKPRQKFTVERLAEHSGTDGAQTPQAPHHPCTYQGEPR